MRYNWQQKDWPNFQYQTNDIEDLLFDFAQRTGRIGGVLEGLSETEQTDAMINLMVSEAIKTSEIEGEYLSRNDVMSSIKRNLGIQQDVPLTKDKRAEGIAELMLAVRKNFNEALSERELLDWHSMLMKGNVSVQVGQWRTHEEPMQIVSGAMGREVVHFQAPPSERIPSEMEAFIAWFNKSQDKIKKPIIRAAVAHLYFESIHPFEDGNGRIGRAIAEKALSQSINRPVLFSLSKSIESNKNAYYDALKKAQHSNEITEWVNYFVQTVLEAQIDAEQEIEFTLKKTKFFEFANRKKAIHTAIKNLNTGELLLIAGKGHEKIQDYGNRKIFFSDQENILKSIKYKNKTLSADLKLNIIKEKSKSKIRNKIKIKKISIDSKSINKDDVFFAIKGKRIDGNDFILDAFKKRSSLAIVNKIRKDGPKQKQIKVKDTLKFLTQCSSKFRENINTKIISITGSCGKTTLKEMLGLILKKLSKTSFSPKSFNNKYGVPLSLFNIKQNDDFGVLEVGMDKKGEINNLTKIIKPDLGIITNISYAHSKNFKKISQIADAKAEIMSNIKKDGTIVLNMDDDFYNHHRKLAQKKKLNVITFGINNRLSMTKLINIKKINKKKYELLMNINGSKFYFLTRNKNRSHIYNILATLAVINFFNKIKGLNKNIFYNLKTPEGRGDISKINLRTKYLNLVDEAYNSNPLSLKNAIESFDQINSKNKKKYLLLGDMLELGKHSIKQHRLIGDFINKTKINKVYVIGRHIRETFNALRLNKKGKILNSELAIFDLINNELNNNDYLMIKGSNSTGLCKITRSLKKRNLNAI